MLPPFTQRGESFSRFPARVHNREAWFLRGRVRVEQGIKANRVLCIAFIYLYYNLRSGTGSGVLDVCVIVHGSLPSVVRFRETFSTVERACGVGRLR